MNWKNMKSVLSNALDNNKDIFIKHKKTIMIAIIFFVVAYFFGFAAIVTKYASVANLSFFDNETNYKRTADPNTMEDYLDDDVLGIDKSSRHAGRIWTDKTVFAKNYRFTESEKDYKDDNPNLRFLNDTLTLNAKDDGSTSTVQTNTDFLHVFSAVGSSQVVDQYTTQPLDVVLLLDISSSMTRLNGGTTMDTNDSLHQVIKEANDLINQLMGKDPNHTVSPLNRVGVVVYGGGVQKLLPLKHYSSLTDGIYMTISGKENKTPDVGKLPTVYFPKIKSTVNENSTVETEVMRADSTYLQGALYEGMEMLANEKDTTYENKATGQIESRMPVVITLTDGATNIVSATKTTYNPENKDNEITTSSKSYDWWEPYDGIIKTASGDYAHPGTNPIYANCNDGTGKNGRETEIEAISTRTVSNLLLASYYKKKIENHYGIKMKNYSIGFNIKGLGGPNGDYPGEQLLATLNPKEYFNPERKLTYFSYGGTKAKAEIDASRTALEDYVEGNEPSLDFPRGGKKYTWAGNDSTASFTWKHPEDKDNDLTKFEDVYYIDKYYTADNNDIANIFDSIFEEISGSKFNPIDGVNDAGVNNSLLYMDPIGENMEVKDNGVTIGKDNYDMSLLLFEKMHGLVKAGIYDYKFNSTHRGPDHNSDTGSFQEGWYDKDGKFNGEEGSFENGDTYYFSIDTIRKYVSTLDDEEDSLTNQEKNTVYKVYRFADSQEERLKKVNNPCYEAPEEGQDSPYSYSLSDIRVWIEDTGDFVDEQSGGAIDLGYNEALYISIPKNALPVLTANISIGVDGNITYKNDVDYIKNMGDSLKSTHVTPLRLFYGVGVSNNVLTDDGLDIDIAKLDKEYIEHHTDENTGDIYFLSNYYSNTGYSDYVSDTFNSRSRGDANSTFSPSTDNRYYAFQKPIILYKVDDNELQKDANGNVLYQEKTLTDDYATFIGSHSAIKNGSMSSNSWYWIVGDYYTSDGKTAHIAVTRKGSEFGSAIGGEDGKIKDGEYLVWYNPTGKGLTQDNIREYDVENPTPPDKSGNWVIATKPGGLRVGDLGQMVTSKEQNVTSSAYNVYVPTISSNTTNSNIIIDNYHGNNGRIVIPNKLLQVTKEVEEDGGKNDPNKEFKFEVRINKYVGDHDAIVLVKNPYSKEWQLKMDSIDIVTNNQGLLQTEGHGDTTLATVPRDDKEYYVYVGTSADGSEENIRPLYKDAGNNELGNNQNAVEGAGRTVYVSKEDYETLKPNEKNNMRYGIADNNKNKTGSVDYWVDKVYLIPKEGTDIDSWTFNAETADSLYKTEERFVISHLDSTKNGINQLTSDYATKSVYLTKKVYFGYDEEHMPSDTSTIPEDFTGTDEDWKWVTDPEKANKASFTLKADEGLEFVGIDDENDYDVSVVEVLDGKDIDEGYGFNRVEDHESNTKEHEVEDREDNTTGYKVSGKIADRVEEHYINTYRANYDLTLSKTIMGSLADKDQEWTFRVKLTPEEFENFKKDYVYQTCTLNKENTLVCDDKTEGKLSFELKEDTNGKYYEDVIKLKAGEIYRIKNIDYKCKYEVVEDEANDDGYDTTFRTSEGYDANTGDMSQDRNVGIINAKFAPVDLSVAKTVKGSLGDFSKDWSFKVTLIPEDGYVIKDSYKYEGSKSGEMQFVKNDDGTYSSEFTLKNEQKITIKDLPEGIKYKVEEKEANTDDYITTVVDDNAEGEIKSESGEVEVRFVNAKYDSRKLAIGKRVEGSLGEVGREFIFNITLIPSDNIELDSSYHYVGSHIVENVEDPEDGKIEFTKHTDDGVYYTGSVKLKHGQIITIEGIPEGTQYLVKEENVTDEGYTTTTTDNKSGMLTTEGETVIFVNTKIATTNLKIKKIVTGNSLDTGKEWNFEVYLTPPFGVELNDSYHYSGSKQGDITFKDNKDGSYIGKFTLKDQETITIEGLPEGTKYKVVEVDANKKSYITGKTNNTEGTLEYNETPEVTFTNMKLDPKTLTINKEVLGERGNKKKEWTFEIILNSTEKTEDEITYSYVGGSTIDGVSKPEDGELSFRKYPDGSYRREITLKHGQFITITGLDASTEYKVEEKDANKNGYITYTESNTGEISGDVASLVVYNNNLPGLKDLTLEKLVHGSLGEVDKEFTFMITFTPDKNIKLIDEDGIYYGGSKDGYYYDGSKKGYLKLTYNKDGTYIGTVSLHHTDKITIHGIPEDTKYEILETGADGYKIDIDGRVPGRLLDNETKVTYNNIKSTNFDLSIKKNVKGNMGDKNREWNFKVLFTAPAGSTLNEEYSYTKNNGEKGTLKLKQNKVGNYEGSLQLKDGEVVTIEGLPEGTKYVVEEEDVTNEGYTITTTDNTNGVIDRKGILVEFNNWKLSKHRLVIEKRLKGDNVEVDREWNFEVTLTTDKGVPMEEFYPYIKNNGEEGTIDFVRQEDGTTYKATVKLKGGEYISIEDIPYNTKYDVKEVEANKDNYKTTDENSTGTLTKREHKAVFINERNKDKPKFIGNVVDNPFTADGIVKYFLLLFGATIGGFAIVVREYCFKK